MPGGRPSARSSWVRSGGEAERIAARRAAPAARGEAGDLLGGREGALEEGGGEGAGGGAVEPVGRLVGREERRRVDLEAEQIADRVLVLEARQAADGVGRPRAGREGVEGALEAPEHRRVGLLGGPRLPGRGHLPGAEAADDLFPGARVEAGLVLEDRLEVQAGLGAVGAVAVEAGLRHLAPPGIVLRRGRDGQEKDGQERPHQDPWIVPGGSRPLNDGESLPPEEFPPSDTTTAFSHKKKDGIRSARQPGATRPATSIRPSRGSSTPESGLPVHSPGGSGSAQVGSQV